MKLSYRGNEGEALLLGLQRLVARADVPRQDGPEAHPGEGGPRRAQRRFPCHHRAPRQPAPGRASRSGVSPE